MKKTMMAADRYRTSVIPRADSNWPCPMWYGWVIVEAFKEGVKWERSRASNVALERPAE